MGLILSIRPFSYVATEHSSVKQAIAICNGCSKQVAE